MYIIPHYIMDSVTPNYFFPHHNMLTGHTHVLYLSFTDAMFVLRAPCVADNDACRDASVSSCETYCHPPLISTQW